MIDVNTPIIYIHDYDFARIDELIKDVIGETIEIQEWNPGTGQTNFWTKEYNRLTEKISLEDFLLSFYKQEILSDRQFIVLRDIQDYIEEPKIKTLLQLIAQRKLYDRDFETTIIIISSVIKVPEEIEKYVSFLEIEFPDDDEIKKLIDEHIETNGYDKSKFTEEDRGKLMPSLKGMTCFEIDRMLDMAMSSNGSLSAEDREMILQHKKQMVKKSGLLELIDSKEKIENIGGLDALKEYMKSKAYIIKNLPEAMKFHVAVPKGAFIVGMPGCGKSLCAKACASLFEVPLLKMDMGSMMGKYVGQSEENLRKAIRIAEAAAPCILWVDEIEKAFSGIGGNNDIMTRMFGYFLSWMQDKTSSVYVLATANNADNLPPELKRKGRFDEIFCVNLPNDEERKAIFNVHLSKRKQNIRIEDNSKSKSIITATKGDNGADIESIINEALEQCFINDKNPLSLKKLLEVSKATNGISKSCKKQIDKMEEMFKESNFTPATTVKKQK